MRSPLKLRKAFVLLLSISSCTLALDYFPGGYFNSSDVTTVTWAHGVNSKSSLETNLNNEKIRMLEADLVMGTLINSTENIVIMAHPPANQSDLSFTEFLNRTMEYNKNRTLSERKGIKLDFKQWEAASQSLQILERINQTDSENLQFPIWINADILPGPVNGSTNISVNGTQLIRLQQDKLPKSTLSLGWTTRFEKQGNGEIIQNGSYSMEQVNQMVELIKTEYEFGGNQSNLHITFPLRAVIALNSVENIKVLLNGVNFSSPSVTLWEGSDDPQIYNSQLNKFLDDIGRHRVFVDLPRGTVGDKSAAGIPISNFMTYFVFITFSMFVVT